MKKYFHDTSHQIENIFPYKYAKLKVIPSNSSSYLVFYSYTVDFQFNTYKTMCKANSFQKEKG